MKKILLSAVLCMGIIVTVNAQESPLKAYLGKYIFAPGSPVAEMTITIEDSSLMINSAMGTTAIEKKGTDTFYLAQYDANVVFKRDANNVVVEVSILVQGMDLVGKKESVPTVSTKEELFFLN